MSKKLKKQKPQENKKMLQELLRANELKPKDLKNIGIAHAQNS
jgi:hypothetical protein